MAQVRGLGPRVGFRLALFCIQGVRHPCSDFKFVDMLRRLINNRIWSHGHNPQGQGQGLGLQGQGHGLEDSISDK